MEVKRLKKGTNNQFPFLVALFLIFLINVFVLNK